MLIVRELLWPLPLKSLKVETPKTVLLHPLCLQAKMCVISFIARSFIFTQNADEILSQNCYNREFIGKPPIDPQSSRTDKIAQMNSTPVSCTSSQLWQIPTQMKYLQA